MAEAEKEDDQIVGEGDKVTEADLKKDKDELASKEAVDEETQDDASEEQDESEDEEEGQESEESKEEPKEKTELAKQFPNLKGDDPETYAKSLETAYDQSFKEVRRLKERIAHLEQKSGDDESQEDETLKNHPAIRYAQRQMEQEAQKAFDSLSKKYPQINDLDTFERFRKTVEGVSGAIWNAEGRQPTFDEAYEKSALVLGWKSEDDEAQGDDKADRLGAAAKTGASQGKTNSRTKQKSQSKVTEVMVLANRKMYPGKTDAEIREELEPFVK